MFLFGFLSRLNTKGVSDDLLKCVQLAHSIHNVIVSISLNYISNGEKSTHNKRKRRQIGVCVCKKNLFFREIFTFLSSDHNFVVLLLLHALFSEYYRPETVHTRIAIINSDNI